MRVRPLVLASVTLILSLGTVGCGGGIKEGMPSDLTPDPESVKLEEKVQAENLKAMKNQDYGQRR